MKSQAGSVAGWRVLFELLQVLPRLPLAEQGLTTLAAGEGAHLHSDDQPTGLRALESGATSARDDGKNVHVGPCPEVAAGGATGERNSRTLRHVGLQHTGVLSCETGCSVWVLTICWPANTCWPKLSFRGQYCRRLCCLLAPASLSCFNINDVPAVVAHLRRLLVALSSLQELDLCGVASGEPLRLKRTSPGVHFVSHSPQEEQGWPQASTCHIYLHVPPRARAPPPPPPPPPALAALACLPFPSCPPCTPFSLGKSRRVHKFGKLNWGNSLVGGLARAGQGGDRDVQEEGGLVRCGRDARKLVRSGGHARGGVRPN